MLKKSSALKLGTTALAAVVMVGGSVIAQPTNAQAAAYYHRTKTTKVSKKSYYSKADKMTYKFAGTQKKFKFQSNHDLSNYTHTTWVRSSKTYVTKHGKKYLYYYVTNAKTGAKGWVWHQYLNAGANYQKTTAKTITAKDYVKAKSGKVYQVNGTNSAASFSKGKALTATQTYQATKKMTFYKFGKSYTYYYVTGSKDTKGWVWSKYLKAGTYDDAAASSSTSSVASSDSSVTSSTGTSTSSTAPTEVKYDGTATVKSVIDTINATRKASNVVEYTTDDAKLTNLVNTRLLQVTADTATTGETQTVGDLAKSIGADYFTGEITAKAGYVANDTDNAKALVNDLSQNATKWDALMDKTNTKMTVAINKKGNNLYLVIELGK